MEGPIIIGPYLIRSGKKILGSDGRFHDPDWFRTMNEMYLSMTYDKARVDCEVMGKGLKIEAEPKLLKGNDFSWAGKKVA
jgi:hypothetical protein